MNCPNCGHAMDRHDPEDGTCDAHAIEGIGVCRCGRGHWAPATLLPEGAATNVRGQAFEGDVLP